MAVIGSGPAGFYTAYRVMSRIENAVVDMYEYLPVPYGLVRFGVAPDHPEVKNCQEKFAEVASSPRFSFIGNIAIGTDIPLASLRPHYDSLLLAYGASKDRQLNIPGEVTLEGIHSARAFVGWYNGLPEYRDLTPGLEAADEAVVIGQGNVAMDVARILLTDVDTLRRTDITEYALETLAKSRIKRVHVVGRRGPLQAAFTIKEARELMNLPSVAFDPPIPSSHLPADLSILPRAPKRLMQVLQKGSATLPSSTTKSWSLEFLLSPTRFLSSPQSPTHLSAVEFSETRLEGTGPFDHSAKAIPLDPPKTISLPASIAFRSIGYISTPIPGLSDLNIPFDTARGLIPNKSGRVLNPVDAPPSQAAPYLPGVYCAGWVARGPTGVIASTMNDAFATADLIAQDWAGNAMFLNGSAGGNGSTGLGWEGVRREVEAEGKAGRRVDWEEWRIIDRKEVERGRERGKEREKFGRVEEMLRVLGRQ
ncbi:MAG: NADPH-adrenodoxin reductase [Geoglossum umbratile]|nr:MAG: NADPH-adrenodoxin reductase [Geoglossum umbratile]